jgi:hypothetical protein
MDDRIRRHLHEREDAIRPDVDAHLTAVLERGSRDRRPRIGSITEALTVAILVFVVIPIALLVGASLSTGIGGVPSPTQTAIDLPGRYSTTLPDSGEVHAQGLAGTWVVEFTPDGLVLMTPPSTYPGGGEPLSGFSYTITPQGVRTNLLIESCGSVGVYSWKRSGDSLTFAPRTENCELRRRLLTSEPWQLVR